MLAKRKEDFVGLYFGRENLIAMYLRAEEASKYKKQSSRVLTEARKKLSGLVP